MKKKSLSSIGDMFDGVLARHNIKRQVVSAQIIIKANELLSDFLDGSAARDIKALSFKDGVLTLACRHNVALYDGEGVAPNLARKLEEAYPSVTFQVLPRLRPDAFIEG